MKEEREEDAPETDCFQNDIEYPRDKVMCDAQNQFRLNFLPALLICIDLLRFSN